MDPGSFGSGLLEGFSFVESIRASRENRAREKRALELRESAARRDQEQHDETMRAAREARQFERNRREAAALFAAYSKEGKIPDELRSKYFDLARKDIHGEDNTRVDRIHRATDGTEVAEISGKRPDGTSFSQKPMSRGGGADDEPIVFAPGDVDNVILDWAARYHPDAVAAEYGKQRERRDIRNVLDLFSGGAQGSAPSMAGASSMDAAAPVMPRRQQLVEQPAAEPVPPRVGGPPQTRAPGPMRRSHPAPPPQSLAEQQAAVDGPNSTAYNPFGFVSDAAEAAVGAFKSARASSTRGFWSDVANVNKQREPIYAKVRRAPQKYADQYLREREDLTPDLQAKLDPHFRPALEEERARLRTDIENPRPPKDVGSISFSAGGGMAGQERKTKRRLAEVQSALDGMAGRKSITTEVGIKGSQKVGEQLAAKVVPALEQAAAQPTEGRPAMPKMQADRQLILSGQGKKRLTEPQLDALARAVQGKHITLEQANRFVKTGQLDAPEYVNWNPRNALMRKNSDGSLTMVYAPRIDDVTAKAQAAAEKRLAALDKNRRGFIEKLASDYEKRTKQKGSRAKVLGGFMDAAQNYARDFHSTYGWDVYDESKGELNFAAMHEGQISAMFDMYTAAAENNKQLNDRGFMSRTWDAIRGADTNQKTPLDMGERPASAARYSMSLEQLRAAAAQEGITEDEAVAAAEEQGIDIIG